MPDLEAFQEVADEFLRIRNDPESTAESHTRIHNQINTFQAARAIEVFYEICPLIAL
jgi:hypothetical protein